MTAALPLTSPRPLPAPISSCVSHAAKPLWRNGNYLTTASPAYRIDAPCVAGAGRAGADRHARTRRRVALREAQGEYEARGR
eukprot:4902431-Pleurochrysis_carterae.AAC.1